MPKVYAVLGLVGVYFFLVFFNIAGAFLVNFAGFLIPGYYSLQALFTAGTADDTQVSCPFCCPSSDLLKLANMLLINLVVDGMFLWSLGG